MCHTGNSNGGKKWKMAIFQAGSNKSPFEKVFFKKNVCHTGTSNGGKKWQMALFQAGSNKSPLEKVFFEKICATQVIPTGVKSGKWQFF